METTQILYTLLGLVLAPVVVILLDVLVNLFRQEILDQTVLSGNFPIAYFIGDSLYKLVSRPASYFKFALKWLCYSSYYLAKPPKFDVGDILHVEVGTHFEIIEKYKENCVWYYEVRCIAVNEGEYQLVGHTAKIRASLVRTNYKKSSKLDRVLYT